MPPDAPPWPSQLATFLAAARADLPVYIGLAALRRIENGGPGRELGVLSRDAPTLATQAQIAAASYRNHEVRAALRGLVPRHPHNGLYTDDFLRDFSARWAPPAAANDPHHLNENHAANLIAVYRKLSQRALLALLELG